MRYRYLPIILKLLEKVRKTSARRGRRYEAERKLLDLKFNKEEIGKCLNGLESLKYTFDGGKVMNNLCNSILDNLNVLEYKDN